MDEAYNEGDAFESIAKEQPGVSTDDSGFGSQFNLFPSVNSKILSPLANATGLTIDKIVFLFCILTSVIFGVLMPTLLSPKRISPTVRHLYSGIIGFTLLVFCYGAGVLHLVALSSISYAMLLLAPSQKVKTYLFFFCMLYLSVLHVIRMATDYGAYSLDVTTPMMIMVAKMSSLGFSVYDGKGKAAEKVRPHHQETKLPVVPSLIEFFGYTFCFLTSFAGPWCHFTEYNNFIHGRPFRKEYAENVRNTPNPLVATLPTIGKKVIECVISALLYLKFATVFDMRKILLPGWFAINSVVFQILFICISGIVQRCKYYVAFSLVDIGCCSAGLGFQGRDPKTGKLHCDGVVNVRITDIEFGSNLRTVLAAWNIGIVNWLRFVVYDRVKFAPVIMTYFYSALWHGFYPGYYAAFVTCGLFISCARWGRRKVRPYFLDNDGIWKFSYDAFTILLTRIALAYCAPAFVLLEGRATFYFYWSVFFIGHILGALAYVLLPLLPTSANAKADEREEKAGGGEGRQRQLPPRNAAATATPPSPGGGRSQSAAVRHRAPTNATRVPSVAQHRSEI